MKNTYLFFARIVLLCGMITMIVSCQKNVSNIAEDTKDSSELINTLNSFNEELLFSRGMERAYDVHKMLPINTFQTKSSFGQVAWKDVMGAITGARGGFKIFSVFGPQSAVVGCVLGDLLVGGISSCVEASGTKAHMAISELEPVELYTVVKSINEEAVQNEVEIVAQYINLPENYLPMLEIGAKHNLMVERVMSNDITTANDIVDTSMVEYKIVSSEEFKLMYNEALQENISNSTNYILPGTFGDVAGKVVNLFMEVYTQYPNCISDVDYIINNYVKKIEGYSELSEEDKQAIYAGLSVAAFSSRYWTSK